MEHVPWMMGTTGYTPTEKRGWKIRVRTWDTRLVGSMFVSSRAIVMVEMMFYTAA